MRNATLTPQQITQVLQLRREAYSIKDIADELRVPKSRIEKLLDQRYSQTAEDFNAVGSRNSQSPGFDADEQEQRLAQMQTTIEADRKALDEKARILAQQEQQILSRGNMYAITTREHSRHLEQLAEREKAVAAERIALEDRYAELQRILQSMPQQEEQYEVFRKRARQDKLANRFNRLMQDVLDHCDDCRWSGDEVDEFLERAESLKEQVTAFCDANQIDERRLLIFQGLDFIIKDVEEEQEEQTSGLFASSSVDFDYGPEHQGKIIAFMVQDFNQQAPAPIPVSVDDADSPTEKDEQDDDWDDHDNE